MSPHPHDKEIEGGVGAQDRKTFEESFLRMSVAARIAGLLEDLGMSQRDLARRLGKSEAWVSKLVGGHQNLTLDTLTRVGIALGVRWNPVLVESPRAGTPAENDPPLPTWIQREGESSITDASWRPASAVFFSLSDMSSSSWGSHVWQEFDEASISDKRVCIFQHAGYGPDLAPVNRLTFALDPSETELADSVADVTIGQG